MGPFADPLPPNALLETVLRALALTRSTRVLELGSRAGYETALLSRLAGHVTSLVDDAQSAQARLRLLGALGCQNVDVVVAAGGSGWPSSAPYSAILVASGATHVPAAFLDQLELDGRLVIPLGDPSGQLLELVRRHAGGVSSETLGLCHLPMLPWASRRPSQFPWNRP
jgi:protein-L-isoaspartate(D-aspartate) O-methyltransferase